MIAASFLDELVKIGAPTGILPRSSTLSALVQKALHKSMTVKKAGLEDYAMTSGGAAPEAMRVHPAEATSRLPLTGGRSGIVHPGLYGNITNAKEPIDAQKFNRAHETTRRA
jgi:hypothetical protein